VTTPGSHKTYYAVSAYPILIAAGLDPGVRVAAGQDLAVTCDVEALWAVMRREAEGGG
jgi:hypothetical protein